MKHLDKLDLVDWHVYPTKHALDVLKIAAQKAELSHLKGLGRGVFLHMLTSSDKKERSKAIRILDNAIAFIDG